MAGLRLKICGIRREEDIAIVNRFPPDYIGFVFAKSRRQVTPEQAARLTSKLRPGIQTVGVFVNSSPEAAAGAAKAAGLSVIQLHGDEDRTYIETLRQLTGLPIWKAVRVTNKDSIRRAEQLGANALLLDAFSEDAYGGTGKTADWELIARVRPALPFFLAGGLNAHNLAAAVSAVRPCGVDLSGGVETNGVKDGEKVRIIRELVNRLPIR